MRIHFCAPCIGRVAAACMLMLFAMQLKAQVKFTYAVQPLGESRYELQITATLQKGWHIYSQAFSGGRTGTATLISVSKNPLVSWQEAMQEKSCAAEDMQDGAVIKKQYYKEKVCFTRKFKKNSKAKTLLKGFIYFQICTDAACLPPEEVEFSVAVPG